MTRIWMSRRTVFAVKLKTEWNCLADLLQDIADEEMKLDEEEMVDEASHQVNLWIDIGIPTRSSNSGPIFVSNLSICAGDGRSRKCGGRCRGRGPPGNTQTRALSITVLRRLWYLFTLLVFLSLFCLPMQHFHFPCACLYVSVRRNLSPFQTWCKSGGDKRNERWSCWDGSLLEIANHCGISESVWICFDMLLCYIVLDISCMFSSGC